MGPTDPRQLNPTDAIRTYRYLRIAMVGAVVLLAASILLERNMAHCWQTSISAYYYTPVQDVFVGVLISVGLALICIKGRTPLENAFLNVSGMLAAVVAVAPTTNVGVCWSVPPTSIPVNANGTLAAWVRSDVHNNFDALLITGTVGVVAGVLIAILGRKTSQGSRKVDAGLIVSFVGTGLAILAGYILITTWKDFYTRVHAYSAVALFVLFIFAIVSQAVVHWKTQFRLLFWTYSVVGALMALGGIIIPVFQIGRQHTVFVLEGYEIFLFAVFWAAQTIENWSQEFIGSL